MDYDRNGIIEYEEFRKHKHTHYYNKNKDPVPESADNTKAGFDQLDLNKDGKITREEETFALMPSEDYITRAGDDDDDADYDEGAED